MLSCVYFSSWWYFQACTPVPYWSCEQHSSFRKRGPLLAPKNRKVVVCWILNPNSGNRLRFLNGRSVWSEEPLFFAIRMTGDGCTKWHFTDVTVNLLIRVPFLSDCLWLSQPWGSKKCARSVERQCIAGSGNSPWCPLMVSRDPDGSIYPLQQEMAIIRKK